MLNEDIVLSYGFVDKKICDYVVDFMKRLKITHSHLFQKAQPGASLVPVEGLDKIDKIVYDNVIAIKDRINSYINHYYGSTFSPNAFYLQEWDTGSYHPTHNENSPRHVQKQISTLVYLNDDFLGGDSYFNNKDLTPPIKKGLMTFFCGQFQSNLHTVNKVLTKQRYTIVIFWSDDNDFPQYKV